MHEARVCDFCPLRHACLEQIGADFVFASFVRKREHVSAVRDILCKCGSPGTKIISKIENQEGLDNFNEILDESDGIMVRSTLRPVVNSWQGCKHEKTHVCSPGCTR